MPSSGQRAWLARKSRNRRRALSLGVGLVGMAILVMMLLYFDWMWHGGPRTMIENTGSIIFLGVFGLAVVVASAIIWPRH
ncbi:MAG: hypothetical protein HY794_05325 [Desulfarculus sp.]|nr:hypothetical protein [Desulfarculus sp.]